MVVGGGRAWLDVLEARIREALDELRVATDDERARTEELRAAVSEIEALATGMRERERPGGIQARAFELAEAARYEHDVRTRHRALLERVSALERMALRASECCDEKRNALAQLRAESLAFERRLTSEEQDAARRQNARRSGSR